MSFHDKAVQYEWLVQSINRDKFELMFVFLNPGGSYVENFVKQAGLRNYRITYNSKKDLPNAIWQLLKIFKSEKPNAVHCHLFDANIAGLTAAIIAGIKKRIYTRHHSTLHLDYFPSTVKWDKYCNSLSTHIVSISKSVTDVLVEKENVPANKIHLIHHGFKMDDFENVSSERIDSVKAKYNYADAKTVVGVVSRYINWKGIEYIVDGFVKFHQSFPDAILVLANASGSHSNVIREHLNQLPSTAYREIKFENDSPALFKSFTYFVHTPVDALCEAYGQIYVEALAARTPSVFTLSGVANEFIKNNYNALVVDYKNSNEIYEALTRLSTETELADSIKSNGYNSVINEFSFDKFIRKTEELYS